MKLLIVESPSKAKTINQYLGKDFMVVSSYGHLRGLPSEEGAIDTENDFKPNYKIMDRSKKYLDEIVRLYKKCSEIYLATDLDREGEAISWHIIEALKDKKVFKADIPIRRVVFPEITKKAILAAIANPRSVDEDLVHAQQTRQALDYLVGFNLSPVLWRKLPGSRSAGRVQSVALRLISEKENEIEKFKSQEYWTVIAEFQNQKNNKFLSNLVKYKGQKLEKFSIINDKDAHLIRDSLISESYAIENVEKKQQKRQPSPPFTTSTMLQEAARKLGFSAKKTSKIAQDLYEGIDINNKHIGLITYMRTDSVNISEEALGFTRDLILENYGKKFLPDKARYYKSKTKNAQEAHEAIRPTQIDLKPASLKGKMDSDHYNLYELIWKRLVASQMENAILDLVAVDIASTDKQTGFRSTGSTINFEGFLKVYQEGKDEEVDENKQILPALSAGEILKLLNLDPHQHFTQPPPRYTEASLVKKMEELGIGRPSTYPGIISILQEREYVRLDKKRFFTESKGRLVSAFLNNFFTQYVEYDFTANLENLLDEIAQGEKPWKKVLQDFWTPFKSKVDEVLQYKNVDVVKEIENYLADYIFGENDGKDKRKCPTCGTGTLSLKTGKYGAFIGCSNYPECKYIRPLGQESSKGDDDNAKSGSEFPKILGENEEGKPISLRKGPYGPYVQAGEGKEIKRTSLPKNIDIGEVDLNYAKGLLSLPRVIGEHPEGGNVKAGIGRFGPYIEYKGKYKSLKDADPVSVDLSNALRILSQVSEPRKGFTKKKK